MKNSTIVHLKDYKKPDFLIENINLEFLVLDEIVKVKSKLLLKKNNQKEHTLFLNGEEIKLVSVKLDEKLLSKSDYELSDKGIKFFNLMQNSFCLEFEVEINPYKNKSLEGFYASGEILCTQCEAEGFRKITYFLDRPDCLSRFETTIIASKNKYPYLLSNGNLVKSFEVDHEFHGATWKDPFLKPAYLFALVAGDFDLVEDVFITKNKRSIKLQVFVDKGNSSKAHFAIASLKEAMLWDENVFNLEYDLDLYMIVAVSSFNMGAMENKGLNIFNAVYVLADNRSATDDDFQNIQAVIGHEYFHNYTGNRVTCRDWFQLTLKEGLTVFRDQEFSSDMLSRVVKRIQDVKRLRTHQFPEDQGPMSHPIKPSSYMEINNFYTATIYEKGAEVIRMLETIIGKSDFIKSVKKYLSDYDGQAVSTEDFISSFEKQTGKDLTQFKNWYTRSGTPRLKFALNYEPSGKTKLSYEQIYTPNVNYPVDSQNILVIPQKIAFFTFQGQEVIKEKLYLLDQLRGEITLDVNEKLIPSLNRHFTAPVIIDYDYKMKDLLVLAENETDQFNKFEAFQRCIYYWFESNLKNGEIESIDLLKIIFHKVLNDLSLEDEFKGLLIKPPTLVELHQHFNSFEFEKMEQAICNFKSSMIEGLEDEILKLYQEKDKISQRSYNREIKGARYLKNILLDYLVVSPKIDWEDLLTKQFYLDSNMTDEMVALKLLIKYSDKLRERVIEDFKKKWSCDELTLLKWFSVQASTYPSSEVVSKIRQLEKDPLFQVNVPNFLRSLYGGYSQNNLASFHDGSGEGYMLMAEKIAQIDKYNPQVAARLCGGFSSISKMDNDRKNLVKIALNLIVEKGCSNDTQEVIGRYLSS